MTDRSFLGSGTNLLNQRTKLFQNVIVLNGPIRITETSQ